MPTSSADTLVLGASGFVGRALVAELLRRGRQVAAAVRGPAEPLTSWLAGAGVDTGALTVVTADITRPGLGLAPDALPAVRDVYNCAARYAFGLERAEARAVNVAGAVHVVEWTATRQAPRRLVHLSGYRVGRNTTTDADYARLGAYEASKEEGHVAVCRRAAELGVPLTVANPASVIGPGQYIGLASIADDLWHGRLPAVPGGSGTFLPVVTLEHFTRFLAVLPEDPDASGRHYWILDDTTPRLPELLRHIGRHVGVRAPRLGVPVALLRRLPRRLTGADPETFSFLSTDRYPTGPANALARSHGIAVPPVGEALNTWADHLVATRFGRTAAPALPHGFHGVAGSRTWVVGDREAPAHVLLHGLPLDAESWAPVSGLLGSRTLAADLPGLGRSSPAGTAREDWLAELLEPVTSRPLLTAHSLACGPAVRYALRHPDRISGLVLIAPPFLQHAPRRARRGRVTAAALRRLSTERLASRLGVPAGPAVDSAVAALRRPDTARRTAAALRTTRRHDDALRRQLARLDVPVTLVAGASDPLPLAGTRHLTVQGAGHYPQLTHPEEVARILRDASGGH
ncbi:alpha/beta fold hydrolase [Streptomyces sp. NRRL S-118]|uniref:alpha/beta fold hydrolase n=1 Tax=Streptomyces sp. NRRL S-118 TaxID=1463881 RepID=UPI0004C56309|nr:alpha/beta fold hydrolase [Streptomyces sp. NRRL S-118]